MLIKHQLRSNFFIISGFHPLFDKEPFIIKIGDQYGIRIHECCRERAVC